MAIYLIEIEDGAHHPDKIQIWNNATRFNVKTGDTTSFTRIGIIRHNGPIKRVHEDMRAGVKNEMNLRVVRIGPINENSTQDQQHWRAVASQYGWCKLTPQEVQIINDPRI